MAIQKINLGTEPLGEGGDTYRSANTKINENFSNTDHAASRLVGTESGNVVEMKGGSVGGFGLGGNAVEIPYINGGRRFTSDNDYTAAFYRVAGALDAPKILGLKWGAIYLPSHTDKSGVLITASDDPRDKGLYLLQRNMDTYGEWITCYTSGNTTKDSKTNLLLASGKELPENSAASRLVGAGMDQLPDNDQALKTALISTNYNPSSLPKRDDGTQNIDKLPIGTRATVAYTQIITDPANSNAFTNKLIGFSNHVDTFKINDRHHQLVKGHFTTGWAIRRTNDATTDNWTPLVPISSSEYTYNTTSASAANVVVGTDGVLRRSSSSEKYKDILSDLELDDESYSNAMQVKPIIYRSKSDVDPQNWHFLSFSAEKLGGYDPALTQWRTHETDPETGLTVELEEKEAEGINLNAICAVLHATNIYQDKKIKELEQRLTALESIIEPKPVEEPIVDEEVEPEVVEEPSEESK